MSKTPFLIAGGGIAGLATAIGLAAAGRDIRVFERSPAFEEVGAGLQMSPNAVRSLIALGAWEAVEPHCVIPGEIHVRDGLSGGLLQRVRLGKTFELAFGAPYRVIHRADLHTGLLEKARLARAVTLHAASPVASAQSKGDGAVLSLATGEAIAGAAVIGADGIGSIIRTQVLGGGPIRPQGHTLYRALIPFADVPPVIAADCVTLWLVPGAHVVHYPVANWRKFNIVAAVEETWHVESWSSAAEPNSVTGHFRDAAPALQEIIAAIPSWLKWRGADIDPQAAWSRGNMAILGDAAHATLPYLAQGAAMSLEDAAILGVCLKRSNLVSEALTEFASLRQARTARIQGESRRLARTYHWRGARRLARNTALRLMPAAAFLNRLQWIYAWRPQ